MLFTWNVKLLSIKYVKELYVNNNDFTILYNVCEKSTSCEFYKLDGYLLGENKLYLGDSFMREVHIGARKKI